MVNYLFSTLVQTPWVVDPLSKVVPATVFHEHIAYMGLTSYEDM